MNGEGRPGDTETANQLAKADSSVGQMPPVGPHPDVDVLMVGALLWAAPADVTTVLALVVDEDIESLSLAEILAAIRRLIGAGTPHGPQLVLDALRRRGELRDGVAQLLREATTCGADPAAGWHYAGAVVAASLRRRVESFGVAITSAAREAHEDELALHVSAATRVVGDCSERLRRLRGES